ncbi:ComEC/Rec2 family competence protein [Alkalihalobacillus sp. 1P02AB]|uniref:ComEC/Rec2 family competence protein n=1 Tax=Alkalihalobacillus sp. 1P02AB TaxID=3132260 RepID=UPI0039A53E4F
MESVTRTHLLKLCVFASILLVGFIVSTQGDEGTIVPEASAEDDVGAFFQADADNEFLTVRYFNLKDKEKSGDSILIKSPEGKTLLIDSGNVNMGDQLNELLGRLGVESLDYAVATHPHHDHIGGFFSLISSRGIDHFYMPEIPVASKVNQAFHQLLAKRQIHVDYLKKGDKFNLGSQVEIEVLNPGEIPNKKKWSTKQINQLALVLKVTYQNNTFLLASDIYKPTEAKLVKEYGVNLQADVLHIPHHGHRTSSSKDFIETANPKYAIISSNTSKWKKVYKRLVGQGIEVYVTEKDGHIYIRSDGSSVEVIPDGN